MRFRVQMVHTDRHAIPKIRAEWIPCLSLLEVFLMYESGAARACADTIFI